MSLNPKSKTTINPVWNPRLRAKASRDWERLDGEHLGISTVAYRTERGAKGQAPKKPGTVIAKQTEYIFYWFRRAHDVPLEFDIVAIYSRGKWHPTTTLMRHRERLLLRAYLDVVDGQGEVVAWWRVSKQLEQHGMPRRQIFDLETDILSNPKGDDQFRLSGMVIKTSTGPPGAKGLRGRPRYAYVQIWKVRS